MEKVSNDDIDNLFNLVSMITLIISNLRMYGMVE